LIAVLKCQDGAELSLAARPLQKNDQITRNCYGGSATTAKYSMSRNSMPITEIHRGMKAG
jgi:ribosomal protein L25 (general stress protein Ctc)